MTDNYDKSEKKRNSRRKKIGDGDRIKKIQIKIIIKKKINNRTNEH